MSTKLYEMTGPPVLRGMTKCCGCFSKGRGSSWSNQFLHKCLGALIDCISRGVCVGLIHASEKLSYAFRA